MTKTLSFACLHCDTPTTKKDSFCCTGCKAVYELLNQQNLEQFYSLKKSSQFLKPAAPVKRSQTSFAYLDDKDTQEKHCSNNGLSISLYVEGIHCHACLWLIEKLPTLCSDIQSARLNIANKHLELTRKKEGQFSVAAKQLDSLGYQVHLIEEDLNNNIQKTESRTQLMRLGISAACAANIMIFSLSIYFGLEGSLKYIFEWLSAALMLPVLFFSAAPFFSAAYSALRHRIMSIDLPIAIALTLGSSISFFNLVMKEGYLYFDSLAMFVFLVLSVRQLFNTAYQSLDIHSALSKRLIPHEATQIIKNQEKTVLSSSLSNNDIIKVDTESHIPADGVLQSSTYIDAQLLTGESAPVKMGPGDDVFAGMKNLGEDCLISVTQAGKNTRLSKLIHSINAHEKAPLVLFADKIAHYFLIFTLSLATTLLSIHSLLFNNFSLGLQSALALIVLACPCALALATPLAYALSIHNAAKKGLCIQSSAALEKLTQVKHVFFDKTGTLTKGCLDLVEIRSNEDKLFLYKILYALEQHSKHPIAAAVRRFTLKNGTVKAPLTLTDHIEEIGKGVSGNYQGDYYSLIGSNTDTEGFITSIHLYKNNAIIAELDFSDSLVDDADQLISELKKRKLDITILSGDQQSCVKAIQKALHIPTAYGRLSPEDKVQHLKQSTHALMIGDGANDTEALLHADVSIAVQGSFEASLKASDIYLASKEISRIPQLLDIAKKTKRVITTNFIFSLSYNALGISLVLFNHIHPLFAAIIMPLSSLTVVLYSWLRLNRS